MANACIYLQLYIWRSKWINEWIERNRISYITVSIVIRTSLGCVLCVLEYITCVIFWREKKKVNNNSSIQSIRSKVRMENVACAYRQYPYSIDSTHSTFYVHSSFPVFTAVHFEAIRNFYDYFHCEIILLLIGFNAPPTNWRIFFFFFSVSPDGEKTRKKKMHFQRLFPLLFIFFFGSP